MQELAAAVKLVVWDLDDTLWEGTLSEGAVVVPEGRLEMVRQLNRRGIVNSICSKNDPDAVRARLSEAGLGDEFVFPRVSWSPKGPEVARIVEDAQLRPENVLFIDDLALNREEVRYCVPGIQIAGPEIIVVLLDLPQLEGKDDRSLSRLHQYRVLERKLVDRTDAGGSHEEFLRSSAIRVEIGRNCQDEFDRLLELVNRTNQLNYTKRRLAPEDLQALLDDDGSEVGYVTVADRYGEYGTCGFYALSNGRLSDFLFSCRVLHMGVEHWLYRQLGSPALDVVGEVATALDPSVVVDWVNVAGAEGPDDRETVAAASKGVVLKGGCDLMAVADFLGGQLRTEFTRVGPTGALVHGEHTEILRRCQSDAVAVDPLVDRLPFLDREAYTSAVVADRDYDVLIYSVLMDYTQGIYRHRGSSLVVPYGQFDVDITDEGRWAAIEAAHGNEGIDRGFLAWFAEEFEFADALDVDRFKENIRWLADAVPPGAGVVLINGAEVVLDNQAEAGRHLHHRQMNQALDEVVAELPNARLCDVRGLVTSADDVTNNLRHYRRQVYLQMAQALAGLLSEDLEVRSPSMRIRTRAAVASTKAAIGRTRRQFLGARGR